MDTDGAGADGRDDGSGATDGPDLPPRRAPWWTSGRLRLALLLGCLAASVVALLSMRVGLFDRGGGQAQASGAAFAPGCPGRGAPRVKRIPVGNLAELRDAVSRTMPPRVGRVYEAGTITTSNLWSDNQPVRQSLSGSVARSVPAGYEIRWWALNREGSEDDVVADVLQFATSRRADDALARAARIRCRRDASTHAGLAAVGAEHVAWLNPDNAWQWDVLVARGSRLYRISDVPPGYPPPTGPVERRLVRLRAEATAEALACELPGAGCRAAARPTNLARLTGGEAAHPPTSIATARARARTYARAVNVRGYDTQAMTQLTHERPTETRGFWDASVRCQGELPPVHAVAAVQSPVFGARRRLGYELAASTVTVFTSEALANTYLNRLSSARARDCIAATVRRRSLLGRSRRSGLRLERISATPLTSPTPASYRGVGPYRTAALRVVIQSGYTTRRGKRAQVPLYIDDYAFAYGRAVIVLTAESFARQFAPAGERYLMWSLVGRAEASNLLL